MAIKFAELMTINGHTVIFYSNSRYQFNCSEFIEILTEDDYKTIEQEIGSFNSGDYLCHFDTEKIKNMRQQIVTKYNDDVIKIMNKNRNLRYKEYIFHFYGNITSPIAKTFPEIASVEIILGFPKFTYQNVIFGSQYYAGFTIETTKQIPNKFTIIPPLFDKDEFIYNSEKQNSILYLGRIQNIKGIRVVLELSKLRPNVIFWIAGYCKSFKDNKLHILNEHDTFIEYNLLEYPNVIYYGFADIKLRRNLLSKCKALIQPSQYVEPFGCNVIEAYLSGTSVITSDKGTFKKHCYPRSYWLSLQ
jgi:glycosyltransferase involved in cell wall biosynthesis